VDWEGTAFRACIDDQAKLLGEFQDRTYTDKESKARPRSRGEFVVADCENQEDEGSGEAS
jgi:hypothetical protein